MKEQKRFTLLVRGRDCRYIRDVPNGYQVEVEYRNGEREIVERSDVLAPNGEEFRGPNV